MGQKFQINKFKSIDVALLAYFENKMYGLFTVTFFARWVRLYSVGERSRTPARAFDFAQAPKKGTEQKKLL